MNIFNYHRKHITKSAHSSDILAQMQENFPHLSEELTFKLVVGFDAQVCWTNRIFENREEKYLFNGT